MPNEHTTNHPDVEIVRLAPDRVDEAAELITEAFKAEPVNSRLFRLAEDSAMGRRFSRAVALQIGLIAQQRGCAFVAIADGRVVGAVAISRPGLRSALRSVRALAPLAPRISREQRPLMRAAFSNSGAPRRRMTVDALAVHPGWEGNGIGRRLLAIAIDHCDAEESASGVYLQTAGERSRRLYENAGFEVLWVAESGGVEVFHMFRTSTPSSLSAKA